MPPEHSHILIEKIAREEWGRVLSILVGRFHDFELAEDALQDALILALENWSRENGIPENPCGWLLQVAKRKMIDQVRRRENFRGKEEQIVASLESNFSESGKGSDMDDDDSIPDERLRLIFTCCHPALAEETRVALTLQTLGGLKAKEVAKAFLVSESSMAQRLVRAKKKIKTARIPYEIPDSDHLGERIESVLSVLYLIFNEGYSASSGDDPVRFELCDEAIRLGQILVKLTPDCSEAKGLLALMFLHHSRSRARTDATGKLVTLDCQDRNLWDRDLVAKGLDLLEKATRDNAPGPYQLQAAISALHAESPDHDSTDWRQIYLLYQHLHELQPGPVVRLNAIVALSYAGGPEAALVALDQIRDDPRLQNYLPFFATEADLHRRLGNSPKAVFAYQRARQLAGTRTERDFFEKKLRELE